MPHVAKAKQGIPSHQRALASVRRAISVNVGLIELLASGTDPNEIRTYQRFDPNEHKPVDCVPTTVRYNTVEGKVKGLERLRKLRIQFGAQFYTIGDPDFFPIPRKDNEYNFVFPVNLYIGNGAGRWPETPDEE